MEPAATGANRITPCLLHVPPRGSSASHSTSGEPPATGIFLSLPSAKNPRLRLSGDQKGNAPLSVPSSGCAARDSTGRSHRRPVPDESAAENASRWPSGEIADCAGSFASVTFSGAVTEKRITGG